MRQPASTLAVDAAMPVAAARGRSSGAVLEAARAASLVTTDRALPEARRRIEFALRRPELLGILYALNGQMTIVPVAALLPMLAKCEVCLRDAVVSKNGPVADAHMLALAWSVEAVIWTTDRDFAGTGVATWCTANLMRGLAAASPRSTFPRSGR